MHVRAHSRPDHAHSERHEEEVREGVDGERVSARLRTLSPFGPLAMCLLSVCCALRMYNAPRRYLFCLVLLFYSYIWLVTGTVCVYDNVAA